MTDFVLERTVRIRAERATVFRYFTDSERFARWWGEGSAIDARPGGDVRIRYPNGIVALGEVLEIEPGLRVVFTFGYESGKPVGPGGSRVAIELHDEADGTRVELRHTFDSAAARDAHEGGWRYQLAVFANVAAAEQHEDVDAVADRLLAAWAETDAAARRAALAACTTEDVEFRDAFGCTAGRDELDAHIAAAQAHLPGAKMVRSGPARQCQGTALVDWRAAGPDGTPAGAGTNVLELAPDGRVARVTGIWGPVVDN